MISDVPCEPPDSMAWTWRGGTLAPAWKAVRRAAITAENSSTLRVFSVSITCMQSSCRTAIIAWAGPYGPATPGGRLHKTKCQSDDWHLSDGQRPVSAARIVISGNGGMHLPGLIHAVQYFAHRFQKAGYALLHAAPEAWQPACRLARRRGPASGIFHDLLLERMKGHHPIHLSLAFAATQHFLMRHYFCCI